MVKRKGTTSKNILEVAYDEEKSTFLKRIHTKIETKKFSEDLIINWDPLNIVPVAGWTMANEESKREEINEIDDTRQITETCTY